MTAQVRGYELDTPPDFLFDADAHIKAKPSGYWPAIGHKRYPLWPRIAEANHDR